RHRSEDRACTRHRALLPTDPAPSRPGRRRCDREQFRDRCRGRAPRPGSRRHARRRRPALRSRRDAVQTVGVTSPLARGPRYLVLAALVLTVLAYASGLATPPIYDD